ncbi:MAG TPA: DNA polymerase III subunit gamma/tau [Gammaproteobacteria bacterium]|nr:DNA polymerase III subunit gamma/tau [Gammaproteobacteria bacterium]
MSYQVLARKWRPKNFQDLVGQEHVLRVLVNALSRNRIHHAYLFAGTRGVGKTTLARIFAKCLNCEVAISASPCGSCASCRAVDAGQFLDLYEIDAASRTKVEDTRDLLENVAYPPVQGRYKVYLIDEVHMLSSHSFNALLKTLEEPPPQVIFIFATTEPKKLPITILSRCLQFHLKQILPEQISGQLKHICENEQVSFEDKALNMLANAADGSLRDALSLLDQAIVFSEEKLTYDHVATMLGFIAQDEVADLMKALANQDGQALLAAIDRLKRRAPDYHQILAELISILHQTAVAQVVPGQNQNLLIEELAQKLTPEDVQLYYQIALLGQKDLPYAPNPAQGLEMIMLRMLAFKPTSYDQPAKPVPAGGTHSANTNVAKTQVRPEVAKTSTAASEKLAPQPAQAPKPTKVLPISSSSWREILPQLGLTGLAQALALNCSLEKLTDNKVEFALAASYQPMVNPKLVERIEQALTRYCQKEMKIQINITAEEVVSPAKQQEAERVVRRAAALESLQQDSAVQKIQNLFNASLDSDSLTIDD